VAAYFNVSKWQVLDYVENHGLPCKRLSPRVWRFVPSEVLAWAEARRTSTPERQQ
jgi:hypothetical protein